MLDPNAYNWTMIVPGLIIGLFGWLLYWTGLPLIGGVVGAGAGGALGYMASGFVTESWAISVFSGVGLVLGAILGVFLIRTLQLYFFFAAGAGLGGALCWNVIDRGPFRNLAAESPGWGIALIVLLGALAGGLMVLYYRRFVVAVVTSFIGMLMVAPALPEQYQFLGGLVALAFFLAVQCGLVGRYVDKDSFDRRTSWKLKEDKPHIEPKD